MTEERFSETFPAFVDSNCRNMGIQNLSEFSAVINEWLRLTPDYLDPTKETGMENGVNRDCCKDNMFIQIWWKPEANRIAGHAEYMESLEVRQEIKKKIRWSLLDLFDNGRFESLWVADFPILNDEKFTFAKEDCSELMSYLDCWTKTNYCKPVFVIGHADEEDVYIHWHVVFVGQMDYSRSKRLEWLRKKEAFKDKGRK